MEIYTLKLLSERDLYSLGILDVEDHFLDLDGTANSVEPDTDGDGDDDLYTVVSDGTDTEVYLSVGGGDAVIDAGDLTLIVTLEGVSAAGILTHSDWSAPCASAGFFSKQRQEHHAPL